MQNQDRRDGFLGVRLPWAIWGLSILLMAGACMFLVLNAHVDVGGHWGPRGFWVFLVIAYATVGAVIASRHYRNLVGWSLLWIGFISSVQGFATEYAVYTLLNHPGALPGGVWMAWIQNWIWTADIILVCIMLLYFPSGHLPSHRWLPAILIDSMAFGTMAAGFALQPGPLGNASFIFNPLSNLNLDVLASLLSGIGFGLSMLATIAAALSLWVRFRRATGPEQQQIKWLVYAAVLVAVTLPPGVLIQSFGAWLLITSLLCVPVAVGIAILRYHLYDIDLIIRRTLIYSTLTALLAFVYLCSVIILQQLFRALTGQQQSQIVVVLSTLAIAALFNPLRHRVQDVIDRRFYRRKYDAARVLAAFGATVRDEVELEKLSDHLLGVVAETMQPTQVSLWLKTTNDDGPRTMRGREVER